MNGLKAIGICLGMALVLVGTFMPGQSFSAMIDPSFRFSQGLTEDGETQVYISIYAGL